MNAKNKQDVILYLAFWALYAPSALALWYYERGSLLKLSIVLLMGLGTILGILFGKDWLWRRKKAKIPECEEEPDKFIGFKKLFSQSKHVEVVHYE